MHPAVGQKLMGSLKGIAKKALPVLGSALGNMIVPGLGGVIGGKLASAAGVAKSVTAELLQPGGIVTTPLRTGQQWDAPNGWAPLQWIAVDGLRRNGQTRLAEAIACRWLVNVQNVYSQSGKLVEKYDVMTPGRSGGGGEYPTQDGFGWTNGVVRKLMALYPTDAGYVSLSQCIDPTRE